MTEHVLVYDHSPGIEVQQTYFWCGPTSAEIVLNGRGIILSQQDLANEIGTTVNGTDYVGLIERVLNNHLPDAHYTSVYTPIDPEVLWRNIVASINAGYGLVFNIDVPPSNYPRGVKGSASPAYSGGEVFHYIAGMGYDDNPALRAVWIADPGFRPFGYWVALDQLATMIPPKGYTYSTAQPTVNDSVEAVMATNQQKLDDLWNKVCAYPDSPDIAGKWPTRARYAPVPGARIDDTVGMSLFTNADGFDLMVEFAASQGYEPARQWIAARAKAHPEDGQAVFYAQKYPPKS